MKINEIVSEILSYFEELLQEKNIIISNGDREGSTEEACLFGSDYYALEDKIKELLEEEFIE